MRSEVRNLVGNLTLHLLGQGHVLKLLLPFLAELVQRLAEIFLYSLVASELGLHLVNMLVQLARNHLLVDSEGIDPRLHKEEFGLKHLLEMLAPYILVGEIIAVNPH